MTDPPRSVALLANPAAGRGRGAQVRPVVADHLRAAGIRVHEIVARDAQTTVTLTRQAVADGVSALVVCGGDGTFHLGLQAVAGTDTPIGLIPSGTGDDLARHLDLPRRDPVAAAQVIVSGRTRTIDLARTGDIWYSTVLAAGFDALVSERANQMTWPKGQMRYHLATVAQLRALSPIPYTIEMDGETRQLEAVLVAVGNGPSFGGGLRICEGAEIGDGLLDVVIIKPMSRLQLIRTCPMLFQGTHVTHPLYERHRVQKVTIAAPGVVGYADGERIGPLPLTVTCVPQAVKVFS